VNELYKFLHNFTKIELKEIGGGNFDIGQESDVYIDEMFLGLSLKDDLLYIYFHNCPGRDYVVYKWPWGKEEFDYFIDIINEVEERSTILGISLKLLTKYVGLKNVKPM